jgi:hypothetical protein
VVVAGQTPVHLRPGQAKRSFAPAAAWLRKSNLPPGELEDGAPLGRARRRERRASALGRSSRSWLGRVLRCSASGWVVGGVGLPALPHHADPRPAQDPDRVRVSLASAAYRHRGTRPKRPAWRLLSGAGSTEAGRLSGTPPRALPRHNQKAADPWSAPHKVHQRASPGRAAAGRCAASAAPWCGLR